jgi:hypothetical protein
LKGGGGGLIKRCTGIFPLAGTSNTIKLNVYDHIHFHNIALKNLFVKTSSSSCHRHHSAVTISKRKSASIFTAKGNFRTHKRGALVLLHISGKLKALPRLLDVPHRASRRRCRACRFFRARDWSQIHKVDLLIGNPASGILTRSV